MIEMQTDGTGLRAMRTSPAFWLAMFAASAFGTNLGDLWTGRLWLSGPIAFASLVVVSAMAILADRRFGLRTAASYWLAIVVLRAAATNVADFLIDQLRTGFAAAIVGTAALALAAGAMTRPGATANRNASPVIDGWYWLAMFIAGFFGTVAGDLMNRAGGVVASAAILTILLIIVGGVRARFFPAVMVSYCVAVLAERSAGTLIGDGLASRGGASLGLQVATEVTASLFAAALIWRGRQREARPEYERPLCPAATNIRNLRVLPHTSDYAGTVH